MLQSLHDFAEICRTIKVEEENGVLAELNETLLSELWV
jgi:hypothetical protein